MLTVVVYVGQTEVARAVAGNVSNLANISDYTVKMRENGAEHLGIEPKEISGAIEGHDRRQSVWRLVQKMIDLWTVETSP